MRLISLDEAWAIIADAVSPLGSESVPLPHAAGRVLAAPVVAAFDSPRCDVSMMDGYAVRGSDGSTLRLIGTSAAGAPFPGSVGDGEAVRIFTGAAVPEGARQIVIQENATASGEQINIDAANSASFIRTRASDFAAGDEVIAAGSKLTPGALVAAAGAGAIEVTVARRPRAVTIATGDELRPIGAPLGPDHIPDSIAPGLAAMLTAIGAALVGQHVFGDDLAALEAAAKAATDEADLIVVTGGASVGERDHAKAMFAPLGLELLFSKVAIKPGKPVWLGRVGACWVMGLPGNPGSAMVTARLLLAPLVAALLGQRHPSPLDWVDLSLGAAVPATGDRETFVRAALVGGKLVPVTNQDSGAQRALAEAGWLIRCRAGQAALPCGEAVGAILF